MRLLGNDLIDGYKKQLHDYVDALDDDSIKVGNKYFLNIKVIPISLHNSQLLLFNAITL